MGKKYLYIYEIAKLFMAEEQQRQMNIFLINLTAKVNDFVKFIPGYVWITILILVVALIAGISMKYFKKEKPQLFENLPVLLKTMKLKVKIYKPPIIILFSPSSTSFEKFKNEFDRGEKFNLYSKS